MSGVPLRAAAAATGEAVTEAIVAQLPRLLLPGGMALIVANLARHCTALLRTVLHTSTTFPNHSVVLHSCNAP